MCSEVNLMVEEDTRFFLQVILLAAFWLLLLNE
jgi:hypothetical protein